LPAAILDQDFVEIWIVFIDAGRATFVPNALLPWPPTNSSESHSGNAMNGNPRHCERSGAIQA
jgi:hypothetical protein